MSQADRVQTQSTGKNSLSWPRASHLPINASLFGDPWMQRTSSEATTVKVHNHGVQPGGWTCKSQSFVSINLLQPYACMPSHFNYVQLFATPWSPPGSSVLGILQARILEWVAIPFSRGTWVSSIAGGFFTI